MYSRLFDPITINTLELRNRIAYPSLATVFTLDRKLSERHVSYYREKAKGGAGLVTLGPVGIDDIGSGIITPDLSTDEAIPAFRQISKAIQEEGAKASIQLFQAGAYAGPIMVKKQQPLAPSAIYSNYAREIPKEMTLEEIQTVQKAFVDAAIRAQKAGFDAVELIGSAGYLISQFLSPLKNQRQDQYGGSFENRLRFPLEIIRQIRHQLGDHFAIILRMAGNDFVPGSTTDLETPLIAQAYQTAGVDALNVTGGWHEARLPQMTPDLPRSGFAYLAGKIRSAVSIPVMASNRITSPADALSLLSDGYADMVNLGRVLIADPHWPRKAQAGKPDTIRPCIACLQGCMDNILVGNPLSCIVNPLAGFEGQRTVKPTRSPKKVMVVGAGPAGLEAAITAAQAGHQVELFEKQPVIGGQLVLAAAPPHKQEILEIIRYYSAMLEESKTPVHLNTTVDMNLIRERNPDHIFIAEGAEALIPPIPGVNDPSVINAWDLLREYRPLGKEVAVIGGGAVGLETASLIASKGTLSPDMLHFLFSYDATDVDRLRHLSSQGFSKVTLFEMLPKVGQDLGKSSKWVLMGELQRHNVTLKTGARVISIKGGNVEYETEGEPHLRKFDNVVLALGSRPVNQLSTTLGESNFSFTRIGDCVAIGRINHAIHGGFLAALDLETEN